MRRFILLASILCVLTAGLAEAGTFAAAPRTDRWNFSLQTRYVWSQEVSEDSGAKINFEDDLGWGFGFGYNMSEQLNLGIAFAWRTTNYTATAIGGVDPTETWTYSNFLDTSTIALTGDYTLGKGRLKPYLSGNLGWLVVDTNITADIDSGCWYYPYVGYVCGSYVSTYGTDAFTYGLGLGLQVDLTPTAFLKVGWDHNWNDLDAMNSNDLLRVDLGFLM